MNRKISIIGLSMLIFGLIIVPGFTADMNQGDSPGKTFGCGSAGTISSIDSDVDSDDQECMIPDVCDGNVFWANFEAVEDTSGVSSDPVSESLSEEGLTGTVIFFVSPYGDEIYYKLTADNTGTISEAYIRIREAGDIADQRLVQIYPSEMDLNLPGHDFMAIGVINADDRFNTAVLGTTDPVGSLIRGFNAGLTYATLLNEEGAMVAMGMIEEADCDALRDLWDFHFGNRDCDDDYDHCDDYDDDDCDDYDDDDCDDYDDNCQSPDMT